MLIYGWRAKNVKQIPLENHECQNCSEKKSNFIVFAHYFHVFWIPLFPYKKSIQIFCSNCRAVTEEGSFPEVLKENNKKLKSAVPLPKYLFAGTILIAMVIGYFTFDNFQDTKKEKVYLENPQIGDVYVLKDLEEPTEYNHYLFKLQDMIDDSIDVSFNTYSYNSIVSKLAPGDGFYNVVWTFHKNEIIEFEKSGELKKVIRNYTNASRFDQVVDWYSDEDSVFVE